MEKITFIEVVNSTTQTPETFAVITAEDGSYVSMLKSDYEKQKAEQSTPNLAD